MYTINNKFEIGEECYSVYRKPVHYKCPVCEGTGQFVHNGYEVRCRTCNASGKLNNPKHYVMDICKVKVRRIIASVFSGVITVKYKVDVIDDCGGNVRNRGEASLFKTAEEAAKYCGEVNTQQVIAEF